MRILVVRAADDARRTAARLEAAGHRAIVSPALDIRGITYAIPGDCFDAVIATSAHAVSEAAPRLDAPLFVVGARTAEAAHRAGWPAPRAIAADAAELAADVCAKLADGARLLYLAGRDRKPDLERAFAGRYDLVVVEVYAAEAARALTPDAQAALAAGGIDAVLHYSRRSAEIFLTLAQAAGLSESLRAIRQIAISGDAAAPLESAGLAVAIAATPDETAMLTLL